MFFLTQSIIFIQNYSGPVNTCCS